MKNNIIPAILDSLDESIKECKKVKEYNPDLFTPSAMMRCYQSTKNKILDLSATNLGERIVVLKSFNPVLYNLFINGDLRLSTAEEILQDENIVENIYKLLKTTPTPP